MAILTVNTTLDITSPGDGLVSLQEAIVAANNNTTTDLGETGNDADEIRFADSLFSGGPVTLFRQSELDITEALTITGPGANLLTINAQQSSRIFNITASTGNFTISGMTLTGGRTTGANSNSQVESTYSGGAVRSVSNGSLTFIDSVITGNSTTGDAAKGGGIFSFGQLMLIRSTVTGNSTSGGSIYFPDPGGSLGINVAATGGGIDAGIVTLNESTISQNSTEGEGAAGGGIRATSVTLNSSTVRNNTTLGDRAGGGGLAASSVTLDSSTVNGNSVEGTDSAGGGILVFGGATITNSTISGNSSSSQGGGIAILGLNDPIPTIRFSTIFGNRLLSPGSGGGISGIAILDHAIVAGNGSEQSGGLPILPNDLSGVFSARFSLIGSDSGAAIENTVGNIIGTSAQPIDPLLAGLDNNGGPTQTHALLTGSPALDAGDPNSPLPSSNDQRGATFPRRSGPRPDMGAFEVQQGPPLTLPPNQFGNEGSVFDLSQFVIFEDNGTESYFAQVDWGDGSPTQFPPASNGRINASHVYRDNQLYTIGIQVTDSNGTATGGFNVFVSNIAPELVVVGDQSATVGQTLSITDLGTISDPGFSNPSPPPFLPAEVFRYYIDWGDGTASTPPFPFATIDTPGGPDQPTLASFDGSHVYTSMGTFIVTVRVADDDMSEDFSSDNNYVERQFQVVVEPAAPQTFVVDTLDDVDNGDFSPGDFSLREAIRLANENAGQSDTIMFAAALTASGPATIVLSQGELEITDAVTIEGPGANLLTIDARDNDPTPTSTLEDGDDSNDFDGSRVFDIDDDLSGTTLIVSISGLTITGGDSGGSGGGIRNFEDLTLTSVIITGNVATSGGGVANFGRLAVNSSTISNNQAGSDGGGIYSSGDESDLRVTNSTITGNLARGSGGGVYLSRGTARLEGTTVSNNRAEEATGGSGSGSALAAAAGFGFSAGSGGGLAAYYGTLNVVGGTITGNSATYGGGIASYATVVVDGVTISNNTAIDSGGGISNTGEIADLRVVNSTISGNVARRFGGGVYNRDGGVRIEASTVATNRVEEGTGGSGSGSAMAAFGGFDPSGGGGLATRGGSLTVTGSVISGNTATDDASTALGGGVLNRYGTLNISDSTVRDNHANGRGGGIFSNLSTLVNSSTISGNSAGRDAGGLYHSGYDLLITNSTISGNRAITDGGGVVVNVSVLTGSSSPPTFAIRNSTITNNTATDDVAFGGSGGGIHVFGQFGRLQLQHVIVAGNRDNSGTAPDVSLSSSGLLDVSFSLIGDNTGSGLVQAPVGSPDANSNLIGGSGTNRINPLLSALANNGGPTQTHRLLPGSPAINAGDPAIASPPEFDQRGTGFPRIQFGRIDMGAFEFGDPAPPNYVVDIDTDEFDGDFSVGDLSLREAIWGSNFYAGVQPITFAPNLNGATIVLTMGELLITDGVTIDASSLAGGITIDASGNDATPDSTLEDGDDSNDFDGSRVFNIDDGFSALFTVSLRGLRLTGADSSGDGGAIYNTEALTLTNLVIENNTVSNRGGAVANLGGSLTVVGSTITNNASGQFGGGINNVNGGLSIEASTISNNRAGTEGGGVDIFGTIDTATLRDTSILGNRAGTVGGGLNIRAGHVLVEESLFQSNQASSDGGGIYLRGAQLTMRDSTVSGNSSGGTGGGIASTGILGIFSSTISGNTATESGGGIYSSNYTVISNSTISGNRANESGGGVQFDSTPSTTSAPFAISNSTITNNTADNDGNNSGSGGGIFVGTDGLLEIAHTIIARNFDRSGTAPDIDYITDPPSSIILVFSLIGDNTGSGLDGVTAGSADGFGNLIGDPDGSGVIDPLLGPLANNGGPTQTHRLLPGSPAINAGDPAIASPPEFDQRGTGFPRVLFGRVDMGAFEFGDPDPPNFRVDIATDEFDGDFSEGDLSLREAIWGSNFYAGIQNITFASNLNGATILLTMGELLVTDGVTIDASSLAGGITIDASGNDPTPNSTPFDSDATNDGDGSRVFNISDGTTTRIEVTLRGMRLTGGDVADSGGAVYSTETLVVENLTVLGNAAGINGGGIAVVNGKLTVRQSTIIGNFATRHAGGIDTNFTEAEVDESTISGNTSGIRGGGISFGSGDVTVTRSTISNNTSPNGAGIWSYARLTVTDSTIRDNTATANGGGIGSGNVGLTQLTVVGTTISGNSAASGGGIHSNLGPLTVTSSTISGNRANQDGGGIVAVLSGATARIDHSTITGNRADFNGDSVGSGGGLFVGGSGTMEIGHTIVAGNFDASGTAPDFRVSSSTATPSATFRFSLVGDNTGSGVELDEAPVGSPDSNGNLIGGGGPRIIEALLSPLANNGGPTQTHRLLPGSPAINGGDAAIALPPPFDQRGTGFPRIQFGRIDMGAYEFSEPPPPNFVVDIASDEFDGDFSPGDLSLREALWISNFDPETRTITFAPGLNRATILLTRGELGITDDVTIDASSLPGGITIDASGNDPTPNTDNADGSRVLRIDDNNSGTLLAVTLRGLTLTGGDVEGDGGGIMSQERLTVESSRIVGNSSNKWAGGIFIGRGELMLADSVVSGNSAESFGGGIDSFGSVANVSIVRSTISGNTLRSSTGSGGGLYIAADNFTLSYSTVSQNSAGEAGGLFIEQSSGTAKLTNVTISGNSALDEAGGLQIDVGSGASVVIAHSTITNNLADSDSDGSGSVGGVHVDGSGTLEITHTIIAGNFDKLGTAPDLSLPSGTSLTRLVRFSLVGDNSGSGLAPAPVGNPDGNGNLVGNPASPIDPLLETLADNGGPTFTHAFKGNSPAINAGDPNFAPPPAFDQRGLPRIAASRVDIGAFEVQNENPVVTANPTIPSPRIEGSLLRFPLIVTYTDPDALDTHTATIDWGDGTITEGIVDQVLKQVRGDHTYANDGKYIVTVFVRDNRGGIASGSFLLTIDVFIPPITPEPIPDPDPVVVPPPPIVDNLAPLPPLPRLFARPPVLPDGGAGSGGSQPPPNPGTSSPAPSRFDPNVVRVEYVSPRVIRQEEVVDAVFSLGDIEMISLLGVDMGDDPVFPIKPREGPGKPEPQERGTDPPPGPGPGPLPEPPLPPSPSWSSLAFWAALAGSGTLWVSGTWWWMRRARKGPRP